MNKKLILYIIIGVLGIGTVLYIIRTVDLNSSAASKTSLSSNTLQVETSVPVDGSTSSSQGASGQVQTIQNSSQYKDGTYSAKQNYTAHGRSENIVVTLSVQNGVVTSLSDQHSASNPESGMYQDSFEQEINAYVTGKNLIDISVSRIGGATDTTLGFMAAITQIKKDATI